MQKAWDLGFSLSVSMEEELSWRLQVARRQACLKLPKVQPGDLGVRKG